MVREREGGQTKIFRLRMRWRMEKEGRKTFGEGKYFFCVLQEVLVDLKKIPSEMEVAPRYNC